MPTLDTPPRVTITVRGRFALRAEDGRDLTPPYRKERAILALLATTPERRLSRAWIQSMLWSEKPPEKASANLRRALANLRDSLADAKGVIGANRLEIWLEDAVEVDTRPDLAGTAELLELVDAPDPAFDEWLRDLRAADEAAFDKTSGNAPKGQHTAEFETAQAAVSGASPLELGPSLTPQGNTIIVIRPLERGTGNEAYFLEMMLIDTLSARLEAEGADEIYAAVEPDPARLQQAAAVIYLELTSVVDSGWWNVHLRALADVDRRFLWSGRLRVPMDVSRLADGADIQAFASRALSQILLRFRSVRLTAQSPLIAMQRAASRLYVSDLAELNKAEDELVNLSSGEGAAVALAWRAFARLARSMEFAANDSGVAAEAESLAAEALALRPANPLVCALGARIALDLNGDLERADHLARAALRSDDGNPYALQASSRVALLQGDVEAAHHAATEARRAAEGLPHVFAWDMEVCLTALGKGDLNTALSAAKAAHQNNPSQRAALRYLVALRLLVGDRDGAEQAAQLLRRYEPQFEFSQLRQSDYPMLTLRNSGFADQLVV
ncbi:DNA-binding transcriptional activator of the SARP family protein [Thalassovita autumnalis]|uniref:DNA-binding transcriptional activator of the SARP family protein n=1 Tax=Thalassovita autumnalis TaxID=2072972 RepID=A0A0P1G9U4_9RHOB|nr:hypothetical protein [Thalassovita autumnalis]CUH65130.1 DNA-binding transcriptional activator of the SARP family protein [Thalassovita autumnalis]CUH71676.1 DNA-binding transcriptional activator of the SARP family protein [Thalassovita autumnalis]